MLPYPIGFMQGAAGHGPLTCTYIAGASIGSSASPFTFNSRAIGTPVTDRLVVCVASISGPDPAFINSLTIGGNAATLHRQSNSTFRRATVGIASLLVPTGLNANIIVNSSNNEQRCRLDVYTITGYTSATPVDSASNNSPSSTILSATLTSAAGDVTIGGACKADNASCAWTGDLTLTEDGDIVIDSTLGASCAHGLAIDTSTLLTSTWSGGADASGIVVANWR